MCVDDVICRGLWADWAELQLAAEDSQAVRGAILQVCALHVGDPYNQRYDLNKVDLPNLNGFNAHRHMWDRVTGARESMMASAFCLLAHETLVLSSRLALDA